MMDLPLQRLKLRLRRLILIMHHPVTSLNVCLHEPAAPTEANATWFQEQ